jgi:hypothetical protein
MNAVIATSVNAVVALLSYQQQMLSSRGTLKVDIS